jgi:hypothetical protein
MDYELKVLDDMKDGVRTMYAKANTPGATFFKLASIPFNKDERVSLYLNPATARTIRGPQFLDEVGIDATEDANVPPFNEEELKTVLGTLRHYMDEARKKTPFKF